MKKIDVSQLKFLGEGRNRAVYLLPSGKNVIKIPLNDDGINDNLTEEYRYRFQRKTWYPLARCRLLNGSHNLIMEYVEFPNSYCELREIHSWIDFVDCWQVGYNRAGKVVAYDYGS